jgi:formylglycine-generating enzyme required for sulfatase activity
MWEKASRGTDGRIYPWGNGIDGTHANYSSRAVPIGRLVDGRVPVGGYTPGGDSPYGCADMAGNVWEWCAGWMDEYEEEKALRGGGWNFTPDFLKCYFRFGCDPKASYNYIGFRCAALL